MEITVDPEFRLAVARFGPDTNLTGEHGQGIVDAMKLLVGEKGQCFALLADAAGVCGTDADYRATTGKFFGQHRGTLRIALFNLSPIIRIVAEMLRIGIGVQMKTFPDEAAARSWLREQGIRA